MKTSEKQDNRIDLARIVVKYAPEKSGLKFVNHLCLSLSFISDYSQNSTIAINSGLGISWRVPPADS